jgi:transposase
MMQSTEHRWRWLPVANALEAFRGIQAIHATRMLAELGDLRRFAQPRNLMGYLGLVPTENSSGTRRHQGAITKAGNSSARRAFIEAAWAYQHNARVSWVIARRQTDLPQPVIELALESPTSACARAFVGSPHADLTATRSWSPSPRARRLHLGRRPQRQTRLRISIVIFNWVPLA